MSNRYQAAEFAVSVNHYAQLPPDQGIEVAFAGRSNAGKSSALNALTGQKKLARISRTPGRTQMINVFALTADRRLVDLPGYGYAKVPVAVRRHWQRLLERYFRQRRALRGLILLMDIRHPLTDLDRQMLDWCRQSDLASHILLTKADKLKRGPALNTLQSVQRQLQRDYPGSSSQLFSALTGLGVEPARAKLDQWFFG